MRCRSSVATTPGAEGERLVSGQPTIRTTSAKREAVTYRRPPVGEARSPTPPALASPCSAPVLVYRSGPAAFVMSGGGGQVRKPNRTFLKKHVRTVFHAPVMLPSTVPATIPEPIGANGANDTEGSVDWTPFRTPSTNVGLIKISPHEFSMNWKIFHTAIRKYLLALAHL